MQHPVGEHRHQRLRAGQQDHDKVERDRAQHDLVVAHIAQAFTDEFERRARSGGFSSRRFQPHQRHDADGDERGGGRERQLRAGVMGAAERQQHAAERGTRDAAGGESERTERDGLWQVRARHERRQQRLRRRRLEGVHRPAQHRRAVDHADHHRRRQHRRGHRQAHRDREFDAIADRQDQPPVVAVGELAAEQREREQRHELEQTHKAEREHGLLFALAGRERKLMHVPEQRRGLDLPTQHICGARDPETRERGVLEDGEIRELHGKGTHWRAPATGASTPGPGRAAGLKFPRPALPLSPRKAFRMHPSQPSAVRRAARAPLAP